MPLSMISVLVLACLLSVGVVLLLTRGAAPLPDYADPDVEEVALEDFLNDVDPHPGR